MSVSFPSMLANYPQPAPNPSFLWDQIPYQDRIAADQVSGLNRMICQIDLFEGLSFDPIDFLTWLKITDLDEIHWLLRAAAYHNQVKLVQFLLQVPDIDPNHIDSQEKTPFYLACEQGSTQVLTLLLTDKRVDINQSAKLQTPLHIACDKDYLEIIQLLLDDPRLDVNQINGRNLTPLLATCMKYGHIIEPRNAVIQVLCADPRIDPNKEQQHNGWSPLLWGHSRYSSGILEILLLCPLIQAPPLIGARFKNIEHWDRESKWRASHLSALVENCFKLNVKGNWIRDETKFGTYTASTDYWKEYKGFIQKTYETYSSALFAQIIFMCDDLLQLKNNPLTDQEKDAKKFFRITTQLPMDLQMIVCRRAYSSSKQSILTKHSELAFRLLARSLTSMTI